MSLDELVRRTQVLLEPLKLKKPTKIGVKYLRKPPFRFLHDIITSIAKQTGFASGAYTESELNTRSAEGKRAKMGFLQRAVDELLKLPEGVLEESGRVGLVQLQTSKMVAGTHAEKTNVFLQQLAIAARWEQASNDSSSSSSSSSGRGGQAGRAPGRGVGASFGSKAPRFGGAHDMQLVGDGLFVAVTKEDRFEMDGDGAQGGAQGDGGGGEGRATKQRREREVNMSNNFVRRSSSSSSRSSSNQRGAQDQRVIVLPAFLRLFKERRLDPRT
jgi:TRAF3-interacting protein 1